MRFAIPTLLACAAVLPAADFTIDNSHSTALYSVSHMNISTSIGRFNTTSGSISFDPANLAASSVHIKIDATSVDSNDEKRDKHLKGADFLDVAQYPAITFSATGFTPVADKENTYSLTGSFLLHGVSKDVTVEVVKTGEGDDPWGNHRIGFETSFTVKRSDFDMGKMLQAVGDNVTITYATEGILNK